MQARYRLDLADRFAVSSATARRFAANPSDPTSRWAPCPAHSSRWITCSFDSPAPGEALPPPIGYGPRLGSVRLDFHQQATRPARRAVRPLLTSPRRARTSRPRRSFATRRSRQAWTGIPGHPRRPPRIRPATFLAHPPRLRDGPLMASGFAVRRKLARTAPPSTRSTPPAKPPVRHVFLGSRFCLQLPSHPASRRRSCSRLVVGAINLHRGLAPPARWTCRAYD